VVFKNYKDIQKSVNTKLIGKKGSRIGQNIISRIRTKKIKNNQFNLKWFFNRYLKSYYKDIPISQLYHVESRLDILLFRTNWFINKEAVNTALKNNLILINNNPTTNIHITIKPGDIVQVLNHTIDNILLANHYKPTIKKFSFKSLHNWDYNLYSNILANIPYLEINNNIKTFIMLKTPLFEQIPYLFNLRKFRN